MTLPITLLRAGHPANLALLGKVGADLAAGRSPAGAEAGILYAVATELVEVGIANRLLAARPAEHPGTDAVSVLADDRTLAAGIAEVERWVRDYEGRVVMLLRAFSHLPIGWFREALAELIGSRRWIESALTGLHFIAEAPEARRHLVARCVGLRAAVGLADERITGNAVQILPLIRRVVGPSRPERPSEGTTPSGSDDWLASTGVSWWSDLRTWAAKGMGDQDLARTWLTPTLRKIKAVEEGLQQEEED